MNFHVAEIAAQSRERNEKEYKNSEVSDGLGSSSLRFGLSMMQGLITRSVPVAELGSAKI